MTRHNFIVATLVKLGFRTSLKGFDQFCECVELYSDSLNATMDNIYETVALDFNCSKSAVEKNLRRLFDEADACRVIGTLFGIDFPQVGNKEIVATFASYVNICTAAAEMRNANAAVC